MSAPSDLYSMSSRAPTSQHHRQGNSWGLNAPLPCIEDCLSRISICLCSSRKTR